MRRIYSPDPDQISNRADAIMTSDGSSGKGGAPTFKQTLCDPRFAYATFVGCSLSILQQLSGINAVMFYSSTIMSKVGFRPNLGTVIVGLVNMVSTFPTVWLLDRFGRKSLMWTLSFVQAALLVGLGIAYMQANTSTIA